MVTHSGILAWRVPWIEEPGGLQSMVSQRIRHDLATKQQEEFFKYSGCEIMLVFFFLMGHGRQNMLPC